jgi:hypothetical protein
MKASWNGHVSVVEALLKHGASLNDANEVRTNSWENSETNVLIPSHSFHCIIQ